MSTPGMELVPANIANALTFVEEAVQIVVKDERSYHRATALYKEAVEVEKEIEAELGTAKAKTYTAWRDASDRYNRYMNPIIETKRLCAAKSKMFEDEQERIRQQLQREAEEAARKYEEEERLANAVAAEEAGASEEEVEAIVGNPMPLPPVYAAPTFERVKGVTRERPYSAKVTNLAALVCHVAGIQKLAHPELLNTLLPNHVALNAMARSQEHLMNLPGVKAGRFF